MTVRVLWLFPVMPWVGLQCVIMVFLDHTHLNFQAMYLRLLTSRSITTTEIYLSYIGRTALVSIGNIREVRTCFTIGRLE